MSFTSNSPLNLLTNDIINQSGNEELKLSTNFQYNIVQGQKIESLFSGKKTRFLPFPNNQEKDGNATRINGSYHSTDIYDISTSSIIRWSQQYNSCKLNAADFAYLKNIGVYPNNRLIIARRFPGPVSNDLTAIQEAPLATLISWVPEDNNFFEITFGEEWTSAKASFESILNDMGGDLSLSGDNKAGMGKLGSIASGAFGAIPLPGLMEGLQYKLFQELGIVDKNQNDFIIPTGDPNLIRQAKQRTTLGKGEAGSGLKCSFQIKMIVEYEQKFINGVDPTIVYFDIIANALSFATSESRFQLNNNFFAGANSMLNKFISGNRQQIVAGLEDFLGKLKNVLNQNIDKLKDSLSGNKTTGKNTTNQNNQPSNTNNVSANKIDLNNFIKNTLGAVIGKYKVALIGVLNSLTGMHSTPWHITIGNPKRPYFSSGDMLVEDLTMSMGPVLGFNDLPSNIKLEVTLKPARNIGADEIYNRFNIGIGRTYEREPDLFTSTRAEQIKNSEELVRDQTKNQNTKDFNDFSALNNFGGGVSSQPTTVQNTANSNLLTRN
jgi:hypothetical protein